MARTPSGGRPCRANGSNAGLSACCQRDLEWREACQGCAKPHADQPDRVAAEDVSPSRQPIAILDQLEDFPGVTAERRVAAEEAGDEEQSPQWAHADALSDERQHNANGKGARNVDDQRAVGKFGAQTV